MATDNILTKKGYDKLKKELEYLKNVERVNVASRIKDAREAGGSVQENTLYDSVIEEQGYVEGRISELEEVISSASVLDPAKSEMGIIQVGHTVVVEIAGNKNSFTIVGSAEANPAEKLISNQSPVAQALLGAKIGDEVNVKTPVIEAKYKVIDIK